jgi:hypothetical protein
VTIEHARDKKIAATITVVVFIYPLVVAGRFAPATTALRITIHMLLGAARHTTSGCT